MKNVECHVVSRLSGNRVLSGTVNTGSARQARRLTDAIARAAMMPENKLLVAINGILTERRVIEIHERFYTRCL